ncbi:hypothetical protein Fmac_025511 [Flemingia macrophylla]|uniref:Uncharacterized protein n=1 Tax=Flemingia macrophylla TaxID=520843 RepID=A0ABD1LSG4_9FABA
MAQPYFASGPAKQLGFRWPISETWLGHFREITSETRVSLRVQRKCPTMFVFDGPAKKCSRAHQRNMAGAFSLNPERNMSWRIWKLLHCPRVSDSRITWQVFYEKQVSRVGQRDLVFRSSLSETRFHLHVTPPSFHVSWSNVWFRWLTSKTTSHPDFVNTFKTALLRPNKLARRPLKISSFLVVRAHQRPISEKHALEILQHKLAKQRIEYALEVQVSISNPIGPNSQLSTLLSYLTGPTVGNVSDCRAYTAIYAASLSDQYSPTSPGTAKCLFSLDFSSHSSGKRRAILISLVSVFCFLALLIFFALWAYLRCKKRRGLLARGKETVLASGLDSMNQSTTVIRMVVVHWSTALNLDLTVKKFDIGKLVACLLMHCAFVHMLGQHLKLIGLGGNKDPRGTNLELTFLYVTSFTLCDLPKFKYNAKCCIPDAKTFELAPNLKPLTLGENELKMIWHEDFLGNLSHNQKSGSTEEYRTPQQCSSDLNTAITVVHRTLQEKYVLVTFQKAASGVGIDPDSESDFVRAVYTCIFLR